MTNPPEHDHSQGEVAQVPTDGLIYNLRLYVAGRWGGKRGSGVRLAALG